MTLPSLTIDKITRVYRVTKDAGINAAGSFNDSTERPCMTVDIHYEGVSKSFRNHPNVKEPEISFL